MVLDGNGLIGVGGHTIHEDGNLATLNAMTVHAAVTLCRLSQPEL